MAPHPPGGNPLNIATPGGWVNKGHEDETFEQLAHEAAGRELLEEAGFVLRPDISECLSVSDVCHGQHYNFAATYRMLPLGAILMNFGTSEQL